MEMFIFLRYQSSGVYIVAKVLLIFLKFVLITQIFRCDRLLKLHFKAYEYSLRFPVLDHHLYMPFRRYLTRLIFYVTEILFLHWKIAFLGSQSTLNILLYNLYKCRFNVSFLLFLFLKRCAICFLQNTSTV